MVDLQDNNKKSQTPPPSREDAHVNALANEIQATTGMNVLPHESKSVVRSMGADISRVMQVSQEIRPPTRSLADAVADLNVGKDDIAKSVNVEIAPQTRPVSIQEQYLGYREKVVEGSGLRVESTPIQGTSQHEDPKHEAPHGAIVHTLKYDVRDLVKDRKISLIRAAALESDKNATAETINKSGAITAKKGSNAGIYLVSALFIVLGIIAFGAVFYAQSINEAIRTQGQEQVKKNNALIFYEHEQKFDVHDLESYELLGGLARIRETVPATLGSITNVILTTRDFSTETQKFVTRQATLGDFFKIIKPRLPEELKRNITSAYMVGVHATEENAPFIMLVGTTYDGSLAGMIAWEDAIAQDLTPFFPSRGGVSAQSVIPQFTDIALDNIDARVLKAPNKKVRVVYAVLEKNVIVITNSIYTLKEIASRIHARVSNQTGAGI